MVMVLPLVRVSGQLCIGGYPGGVDKGQWPSFVEKKRDSGTLIQNPQELEFIGVSFSRVFG